MSIKNGTKINQLLNLQPNGVVLLSSWLTANGYSLSLQKRYKKSKWLESIGSGAMMRYGDKLAYEGAIYALQEQLSKSIHPGGKTALSLFGAVHYLSLSAKKVTLFGGEKEKLPAWLIKRKWGVALDYNSTSFLPKDLGLKKIELKFFSIKVSSPARAIMECLYLVPKKQELLECLELMEGLNNLRPDLVQNLLEQCNSVKVKRLFLYMAEKSGHEWTDYLDREKIDLGSGKRSFGKNGVYISKYQITVPKEVALHGE